MDLETRLHVLDQHLDLLIDATQQCPTLKGESVASTFLLIQNEIRKVQEEIKQPDK